MQISGFSVKAIKSENFQKIVDKAKEFIKAHNNPAKESAKKVIK